MELLTATIEHHRGWVVVAPRGQLDVATAPDFRELLVEAAFGEAAHGLVIDLDGLEFLDSIGLGVLVEALKRARTHQTSFAIKCTRERLLQLLDLTGLREVLPVVDSLAVLPRPQAPPVPPVGSDEPAGGTP